MYQSINAIVLWRVSRGEQKQSLHVDPFDLTRIQHGVSALFLLILLAVAFVCGGGGGGRANVPPPPGSTSPAGELLVGISDAEGDFISYLVDVVQMAVGWAQRILTDPICVRVYRGRSLPDGISRQVFA